MNQIVLRWDGPADPSALLKSGGIDAVWLQVPDERVTSACRGVGVQVLPPDAIRLAGRDEPDARPDVATQEGGLVAELDRCSLAQSDGPN